MAQRSKTETAMVCAALLVGLSMCGNTAQNMSAGSTAKVATVGGVTAAGAAAGYGCSKVGVKTCLGGGGGGGGGGKGKEKEAPTAATTPPVTNPPTPEPAPTPTPAPAPQPAPDKGGVPVNGGTTPGGIIVPNAMDLGKAIAAPMDTGGHFDMPCVAVGFGGVGMSQC